MSEVKAERMISQVIATPRSHNLDIADIQTARKRKCAEGDCDQTKPQLIAEFSIKGVAVHKLLELKEFSDTEILKKIRKIYQA